MIPVSPTNSSAPGNRSVSRQQAQSDRLSGSVKRMIERCKTQEVAPMTDEQRFRRRQMHAVVTAQVVTLGEITGAAYHALLGGGVQRLIPVGFEQFLDRG